jgi:hypothetical protein
VTVSLAHGTPVHYIAPNKALPKDILRNIGLRIEGLVDDLGGDVKKLSGKQQLYECGLRI